MSKITKEQIEQQLEKVCKKADEALRTNQMQRYCQLSEVRTGLRIALGKANYGRDTGNITIDPEFLEKEDEETNDMGQGEISVSETTESVLDETGHES